MKVMEMKIGNSIVEIYDDCVVGPEEVDKILKRIGSIGTGKLAPEPDSSIKESEVKLA